MQAVVAGAGRVVTDHERHGGDSNQPGCAKVGHRLGAGRIGRPHRAEIRINFGIAAQQPGGQRGGVRRVDGDGVAAQIVAEIVIGGQRRRPYGLHRRAIGGGELYPRHRVEADRVMRRDDQRQPERAGGDIIRRPRPAQDRDRRDGRAVVGDGDARRGALAAAPAGQHRERQRGVAGIDMFRQGEADGDRAAAVIDLVDDERIEAAAIPVHRLAQRLGGDQRPRQRPGDGGAGGLDEPGVRRCEGHSRRRVGIEVVVGKTAQAGGDGQPQHPAVCFHRSGGYRHAKPSSE